MSEPRLEDIGDYDTLKGNKKKVVWSVIIIGILITSVYLVVDFNDKNDDAIKVESSLKNIPMK